MPFSADSVIGQPGCKLLFSFAGMPLSLLDDTLWFPPVEEALEDGLLAIGGDLRPERLLLGYRSGVFPWYGEDELPMWWSPDPRFVLFPGELKVSKSMRQLIRKAQFEFRVDTAFEEVIRNCRRVYRKDQPGTWIGGDMIEAYTRLHELGYAHSAEAWSNGELAGGLYGVLLGRVFFGESMFSFESNASKFAFVSMVEVLKGRGVELIDCQVHTDHLESLGARMIRREAFLKYLDV